MARVSNNRSILVAAMALVAPMALPATGCVFDKGEIDKSGGVRLEVEKADGVLDLQPLDAKAAWNRVCFSDDDGVLSEGAPA